MTPRPLLAMSRIYMHMMDRGEIFRSSTPKAIET
jgi:hypothetical protein